MLVFVFRVEFPFLFRKWIHVRTTDVCRATQRSQYHFGGGVGGDGDDDDGEILLNFPPQHDKNCLHKTLLRNGNRNEMQKIAFNNFTGHCQLKYLHWDFTSNNDYSTGSNIEDEEKYSCISEKWRKDVFSFFFLEKSQESSSTMRNFWEMRIGSELEM